MSIKSLFTLSFFLLFAVIVAQAQEHHAADFKFSLENAENLKVGEQTRFKVEVTPQPGWHIYSAIPSEEDVYGRTEIGYEISSIGFDTGETIEEEGRMISEMDDIMGGMMRYYKSPVTFSQTFTLTEPEIKVIGFIDYMACDDFKCIFLSEEFELAAKAAE